MASLLTFPCLFQSFNFCKSKCVSSRLLLHCVHCIRSGSHVLHISTLSVLALFLPWLFQNSSFCKWKCVVSRHLLHFVHCSKFSRHVLHSALIERLPRLVNLMSIASSNLSRSFNFSAASAERARLCSKTPWKPTIISVKIAHYTYQSFLYSILWNIKFYWSCIQ